MKGASPARIPLLASIVILFFFFGCSRGGQVKQNTQLRAQYQELQQKNSELEAKIKEQSAATATMKIQLMEKNAEISRLQEIQQDLSRKIIRSQTRMASPKSKAEAVTVLAEIEMEINAAKKLVAANGAEHSFDTPDKLMLGSKIEFNKGNYNKSCSLAARALERVQSMQLTVENHPKIGNGPTKQFNFPLVMRLRKMSNIRKQPTMHSPVLQILDKNTMVKAIEYQGHWIKIAVGGKPIGWIYYALLAFP